MGLLPATLQWLAVAALPHSHPGASWDLAFAHAPQANGILAFAGTTGGDARPTAPDTPPPLRYTVSEGRNLNSFIRDGAVAAHLVLRGGADPRIIIAFPAGNSGVGLWFRRTEAPVTWTITAPPRPVTLADARGRPLRGIVAEVAVRAPTLVPEQAILSSVRVLRDYQTDRRLPAGIAIAPAIKGQGMSWARDRIDGAAGYRLAIELSEGTMRAGTFLPGPRGEIRLRILAATGETPLTPFSGSALLTPAAGTDPMARNALAFLSYREKFLAGSWRFDTYFGRDTLMSLRLLMPVLQPDAIEAGLGSVFRRLAANGEVAHEEDIGEFAVLRHRKAGDEASDTPVYDYAMVDDDFMLAPVTAAWLLDDPRGRARATAFLNAENAAAGRALARNLLWVTDRTTAFANRPVAVNLVGLKPGRATGQWRDSEDGLGGGRYAYDVNAVFVPAALEAAHRLFASGLLDPYLGQANRQMLAQAAAMANIWRTRAPRLFATAIPAREARKAVASYAARIDVAGNAALASLDRGPLRFHALSLDAAGKPIPVLHSDEGFALLFGHPDPAALDQAVKAMMRPFPAGLMTDVGLLVANPAMASAETRARFGRNAYHGTVIWSWQQAVLAAGLDRQLRRPDLPAPIRRRLQTAERTLWATITRTKAVRTSELWSWTYRDGRYRVAPFGVASEDADESNAAQLWSTVFLGAREPVRR